MLSTVAKLKKHIGIPEATTSKDEMLETLLKGTSAFLESKCNRTFGIGEYNQLFVNVGASTLFLKNCPVLELLEIKVGKHVLDLDALMENDSLILDKESGEVIYPYGFCADVIRIKYTAGYILPTEESGVDEESGSETLPLPDDLELAAIRLAARVYERRTAEGITSASPGSFSANYAQELDQELQDTIDHYRLSPC